MIKYLSLAEVTIFLNMGPILTVFVFSCFLATDAGTYKKCADSLKLLIGLIGVVMIIVGKNSYITDNEKTDHYWHSELWYYAVIAIAPIAIVIINLNLASMRNLHYIVTPFYICVLTLIVCGIIGVCDRKNFLPAREEL